MLDEFFLLLVMFFVCLFVCFRRLTNLHRWMKPNENWKNSKGNYVGVFVLFFFLCEYIFFVLCFFVFVFRASTNTSTFGLVFAQPALEFIPVFL